LELTICDNRTGANAHGSARHGNRLLKNALAALLFLTSSVATGDDAPPPSTWIPRGPAGIRDGQLLAQPRLTLPALSPRSLGTGRWELRVSALWSNSFAWTQDVPGEAPADRRFLIDGETATLDLSLRRGLSANVDVGLRLPAHGRGGGTLDGFIDAWHRLVKVPDGNRPFFRRDAFRVEGRTTSGAPFSWSGATGWGLGDTELELSWRVKNGGRESTSVALVARAALPTSTDPYEGAFGAGGQLVVDVPLGGRVDLFTGLGVTAQDAAAVRGIEYETTRVHGYAALEWRIARPLSLVAETNAASRLVSNIQSYPGTHWLVNLGGRLDLGKGSRLDLFMTENIVSQQSTTDFALYFALSLRP
jgi:hypothetical protein